MLNDIYESHKTFEKSNLGSIWAQLGANLAQQGPKLDPQDPPCWPNLAPSWTQDGIMLRLKPFSNELQEEQQKKHQNASKKGPGDHRVILAMAGGP